MKKYYLVMMNYHFKEEMILYNEDGRMWIIKGFLKSKKRIINYIDKISDEAFFY